MGQFINLEEIRNFAQLLSIICNQLGMLSILKKFYQLSSILCFKITLQQFIRGMSYLLTSIRINMFLKYHVENWLIILDVQNMGALGLPIKVSLTIKYQFSKQMLNQIFEITYYGMTCTNDKLFIVNPSFSVNTVWKVVSAFDPATFSEIKFLQETEFYKLLEFISADQLEIKFGGQVENQTTFWPPKNTLPDMEYIEIEKEGQLSLLLITKDKQPKQKDFQANNIINTGHTTEIVEFVILFLTHFKLKI